MMESLSVSRKKAAVIESLVAFAIGAVVCFGYNLLYFEIPLPNGSVDGNGIQQPQGALVAIDPHNGYIKAIDNNSYKVTNTHRPDTTSVSFSKVWDDEENQDGA